jgi:uncharacterized membrane protein YbhN (UPF0104 family)
MSNYIRKLWPPNRKWLQWGGTLIAAILFIRLLARLNWASVWENFKSLPLGLLLLAFLLYTIGMLANALRWFILLQTAQINIPFWETVKIVYLGAFISNYLPSTIGGDTVRFLSLLRFTSRRAVGFASVVLDRLINLTAMLTILPLSMATFFPLYPFSAQIGRGVAPIIVVTGIAEDYRSKLKRMPATVTHWIDKGKDAFKVWLHSPRNLVRAFVVSWFSIFVIFVAIWVIAKGLGIPVALYQVMGVTAITYLITLLPISVNGYGLRELAIVAIYTRLGATIEQATSLAIITRILMLIETLPGALWIPQNLSDAFSQDETLEDDNPSEIDSQ